MDDITQFATPEKAFEAYISADPRRRERLVDDEDYSRAYCDGKGCGDARVRARVVAALPDGGILCFCFHHANAHRASLESRGALLVESALSLWNISRVRVNICCVPPTIAAWEKTMTTETVSIRMTIGSTTYTLDEVIDTSDGLAALRVGRGISEALIEHSNGRNN